MERNHIAALLAVGIAAGLYAALTYQWVLGFIIVAVVALILVASDVAGRTGA
jgi:tetrahydromethanopterin S-methyltransferase subunit B